MGKSEDTCQNASLFPAKVWAHLDRTRSELVQAAAEEAPGVSMEKKNSIAYPKRQLAHVSELQAHFLYQETVNIHNG